MQRQTDNLRQRVNRAPFHALGLRPGKHGIGPLVRAAVCTRLVGNAFVRANGFQYPLPAICPGISFRAANTVGTDLFLRNVVLVSLHAAGRVMGRVLLCLAVKQAFGTLVNAPAVPVGLAYHLFAPRRKVLAGKRRIFSFCHDFLLNTMGNGYSPSLTSVLLLSSRPCSCASTSFILSGMGRPMWAAFSSRDSPSLER